jgi:thiol:disulfide interchange protein DsbD
MRILATLATLLFFIANTSGQMFDPVKWSFSTKQVSNAEYDLIFTANIQDGWTIYSQFLDGEDGPVPTSFNFEAGSHYAKAGKTQESPENRKTLHDEVFDMEVTKFYKKATFTQRVKVSDFAKPVTGYLEFMTCDNARCLPPAEVEFSFELKPAGSTGAAEKTPAKEETKPASDKTEPAQTAQAKDLPKLSLPSNIDLSNSNIYDPVKWALEVKKVNEQEYDLHFRATIDQGWYIYSQFLDEGGPEPTLVLFDSTSAVEAMGKAKEESTHKLDGFDKIFDMKVTKFKESVTFIQRVNVQDATQTIGGYIAYMSCNDEKCLPTMETPFKVTPASLTAIIGAAAGDGVAGESGTNGSILIDKSTAVTCGGHGDSEEKKGLWGIFILGFLGGLLALLTPCVFPMIPLTVSFFTKGSENKRKGLANAFAYGFFIFAVYLILSLPFHLLDSVNPDILNEVSTNIWLNIAFFLIFLFFAFSFFGYYELTLPSSWANKVSAAEGIGGMLGIFFMALTLALVSFSCTGPILGSLLAGALTSDGGAMQLTAGMGGFGLALALPFGLFAAFPSWLSSLPKSGSWMTTVKVVLGFLELALALKFLSNADLVKHWGLLKIEPFLALWFLIFVAMGLYLLGKIRFPHDSPLKKLSPVRLISALASFAFAIYLVTGFMYDEKAGSLRPLKLLSGLAPPACYSWWYPCDCPQNLNCFKDFDEGLAFAKKMNKPIMIDFTGHACVNCRKMEEHVWPLPGVYKYLRDDYVLISLYVDEKIDLPAEEQKVVEMKSGGTRKLRNIGHKWQYFQTENFDNNSQPFYVLLSPDGKMLNQPVGYTPDASEYANFLECGLERFRNLKEESKMLGAKE